ncbi:DUF4199 domain-containing protein [Parasphingorhabdus litoris]|uniref:DUF4199 domain-containing protein n=1 Tax=Parasphingorhabdus litoris TaxID=394733 RepID=A0ABN1B184_9SPHN|nr:DUF4199 domain-containing protein [Parasphingorhabdus litoris]
MTETRNNMTKIALIYGILSGTIVIGTIILGLASSDGNDFAGSEFFGYLIMIIALSMIFIGVKRYRDQQLGGVIKFLPALGLGLAISVVAGIIYVCAWEIYLFSTNYTFIDSYTAMMIEARKADGLSGAALDSFVAEMEDLKANYGVSYIRIPITFLEIFPVGLIISLLSAALLRNPKLLPAKA